MSLVTALLKKPIAFFENKINEAKQQAQAEIAVLMAKVIVMVAIGLILFIAIAIASVGLALLINNKTGHPYYGFFYVGLGYLVIGIILIILSKTGALKKGVESAMRKEVMAQKKLK